METNFRSTTRSLKLVKTKYMGLVDFETGYIPDWFLVEVLSRLPLKRVFRFKCVSKQWLSLISAPSFVNLYISRVSLLHKPRPWPFLVTACILRAQSSLVIPHYCWTACYLQKKMIWLSSRVSHVIFISLVRTNCAYGELRQSHDRLSHL